MHTKAGVYAKMQNTNNTLLNIHPEASIFMLLVVFRRDFFYL